jgi:hypothetical protein
MHAPARRISMALWPTTLRMSQDLKLLVMSPEGDDLIKARLPLRPAHPRALLTMLEGIALFSGEPLRAVISADAHRDERLDSERWFGDLWPAESAMVRFDFARPAERARRHLHGVGDFRAVRRQLRLVWSR